MSPAAISANGSGFVHSISLDYDPADSEGSARRLLYALHPEWESSPGPLEFVRFKDGITNTLFKAVKKRPAASAAQIDSEAVLLRAYGNGTAVLIDREREAQSHALLARYDLAPALLARFNNGLLYRFVAGDACSPADLRRADVWPSVARKLGQWHAVLPVQEAINTPGIKDRDQDDSWFDERVSNGSNGHAKANGCSGKQLAADLMHHLPLRTPQPNLWTVLLKWIRALPARTEAEAKRNAELQAELVYATKRLGAAEGLDQGEYIMSHCDLLSGNVIIHPDASHKDSAGRERQTVSFIDYEYTTPAPAAFDLANHLAEWAGFECEYHQLPTRGQRRAFLREYAHSYRGHQRRGGSGDGDASARLEADVDRLLAEVDDFRGMPGLFWGTWALIQAEISNIDFDYASYSVERLGEYWSWKKSRLDTVRERRWAEA